MKDENNETMICSICGEEIDPDEEYVTLEDGSIVCESCYEEHFPECDMCGERTFEDDLEYWGDARICPACMEEQCPTFSEADNEAETQAAYDAMRIKYIGKRVPGRKKGTIDLETTLGEEAPITYSLSVTLDEDGIITDVSRLTATMLLSEWNTGHSDKPYPIHKKDYTDIVDDMMEEDLLNGTRWEEDEDGITKGKSVKSVSQHTDSARLSLFGSTQ